MDCSTGHLYSEEQMEEMQRKLGRVLAPVSAEDEPKVRAMSLENRKGWMRNKPCPCGSAAKFKRCCWNKYT